MYGRYQDALERIDSCMRRDTTLSIDYAIEKSYILKKLDRNNEVVRFLNDYSRQAQRKFSNLQDSTELSTRQTRIDAMKTFYQMN